MIEKLKWPTLNATEGCVLPDDVSLYICVHFQYMRVCVGEAKCMHRSNHPAQDPWQVLESELNPDALWPNRPLKTF